MKLRRALCTLAVALAGAAPAFASYSEPAAGLQCSGASIAVRFGRADNGEPPRFDPLPQGREEPWKDVPVAANNRCVLENGDRVELHDGHGLAFGWGMGGADPDGFFSLWINGRKIASREVYYHGYASSEPRSNSLFLTEKSIERCAYTQVDWRKNEKEELVCSSKPINVAALSIDPLLPSEADQARVGTYMVASTYSPAFCRSFVQKPPPDREVKWESIAIPPWAQQLFQSEPVAPPPSKDGYDFVRPSARVDRFDLWNSGAKNTVVMFSGEWKFFSGDVLFYRQTAVSEEDVKALTARVKDANQGNDSAMPNLAKELGWQTLPAEPDRYTYWKPFRLSGTTFILESPAWGSTRQRIYKPILEFQRGERLEEVCTFQMIEEYF